MGDRCYMTVRCRPEDARHFEDLGFYTASFLNEPTEHCVDLVDEEANYAHSIDMERLGKFEKITFIALNGCGGEYPEGTAVGHKGEYSYAPCIDGTYEPAVTVNEDGTITPADLDHAQRHIRLVAAVRAELGI